MDCFYGVEFQKGIITVLGAEKNSDFTQRLADYLKKSGSVSFEDEKNSYTYYIINAVIL